MENFIFCKVTERYWSKWELWYKVDFQKLIFQGKVLLCDENITYLLMVQRLYYFCSRFISQEKLSTCVHKKLLTLQESQNKYTLKQYSTFLFMSQFAWNKLFFIQENKLILTRDPLQVLFENISRTYEDFLVFGTESAYSNISRVILRPFNSLVSNILILD